MSTRRAADRSQVPSWPPQSSSIPTASPTASTTSKVLDENTREVLYRRIKSTSIVGVGIADVTRIDRDNILYATMWAMAEAVAQLPVKPKLAVIDGNRAPKLSCEARTLVKGDARCLSIAAASIIAKVTRDRIMIALGSQAPGLRLRAPQRLRHGRASRCNPPPRRDGASPPLVPHRSACARTRARREHFRLRTRSRTPRCFAHI